MIDTEFLKGLENLKYLLDETKEKEHDSVLKEIELELKNCHLNDFTYRQDSFLIQRSLYGNYYPPYKNVLGNWIAYS